MTKYFEKVCTRVGETLASVLLWTEGESKWFRNSLFICEEWVMTQYVDSEEAEKFHEMVKNLTK